MRLILDHHYPHAIATGLRARGFDVSTLAELQWQALDDETLLARCGEQRSVLLTNNVADFVVIIRGWQLEGRSHAGLIFTSDVSRPRTRAASGAFVDVLTDVMSQKDETWTDRVHWL